MKTCDGRRRPVGDGGRGGELRRGRRAAPILGGMLVLAAMTASPQDAWKPADPDYAWDFPRDHWSHAGYKTEWWYFTGHLTVDGEPEPRFGYQLTFFRIGLTPDPLRLQSSWAAKDLVMGHAAVTDLVAGRHAFSETVRRATPLLGGFGRYPDTLLAWSVAPTGTAGRWTLTWNGSAFDFTVADERAGIAFSLSTTPDKPLIFQGPNGYARKGDGPTAASQYYSFTRLSTRGDVTIDGVDVSVTGTSWMDKEFGSNQLGAHQVGWDWFSLQFHDGRELMLYFLRRRGGAVDFASGTLVASDGTPRYLGRSDWTITTTDRWTSATTGGSYPSRWLITVPSAGIDVTVEPLLAAQENVSRLLTGLDYWEGAVLLRDSTGGAAGRGYVELTGYAEEGRLPI